MENEILKLRQYLLGNLSPKDTEEIDLQIIADETLEEKLSWAESELAEDFLEGTLSPQETELFYKHFLVSPERENQLKHLALLKKYALDACLAEKSAESADKPADNFFRRLKDFFALHRRPVTVAVSLLFICLATLSLISFVQFLRNVTVLSKLETEYVEKNSRDLSNIADFPNVFEVNLASGTPREANSGNKFKQEALTDDVFFRLAVPLEIGDDARFKAQLLKDEKVVFRQVLTRVYRNKSGQEIRLFLPKSVLAKGRYQIKLENAATGNLMLSYNFTIE